MSKEKESKKLIIDNLTINNEERLNNNNETDDKNLDMYEVEKAVYFLISKELKDKPLQDKIKFLEKKFKDKKSSLKEAIKLYPIIERLLNSETEKIKTQYIIKEKESEFKNYSPFKYLKEIGLFSSLIITTLGVNYLLDLSRNKRMHYNQRNFEKKIQDEIKKTGDQIVEEITNNVLKENYVSKEDFTSRFNSEYDNKKKNFKIYPNKNNQLIIKQLEEDNKKNANNINTIINNIDNMKIKLSSDIKDECISYINNLTDKLINSIKKEQENLVDKIMLSNSNSNNNNIEKLPNPTNIDNNVDINSNTTQEISQNKTNSKVNESNSTNKTNNSNELKDVNETNEISNLNDVEILDSLLKEGSIVDKKKFIGMIKNWFKNNLNAENKSELESNKINIKNQIISKLAKNKKLEMETLLKNAGFESVNDDIFKLKDKEKLEKVNNIIKDYSI